MEEDIPSNCDETKGNLLLALQIIVDSNDVNRGEEC